MKRKLFNFSEEEAEQYIEDIKVFEYLKVEVPLLRAYRSLGVAAFFSELYYVHTGCRDTRTNMEFDKEGYFFLTRKKVEEKLYISTPTQIKYTEILKKDNIIKTKIHPISRKLYYKINFKRYAEIVQLYKGEESYED